MKNTRLFNKLMLSNCPLSNWDLSYLKTEGIFQDILAESNIYMIVQRPVLYFHNLYVDPYNEKPLIRFEIRQKGNEAVLECAFPYGQSKLSCFADGGVKFHFTIDYEFISQKRLEPPFNNITTMLIYKDENGYGSWFTPEKMLFDYWNEILELEINGDITSFLQYKVHYIGKATEEHILRRLTGHEHLQDVLSIEMPLQYGSLPTDEIALLFFEFSDNIHLSMFSHGEITEDIFEQLMSGKIPEVPQRDLYLDAEKALIHAFTPKHNRVIYKHYPKGKQNLLTNPLYDIKAYTYSFLDPITLIFNDKFIKGNQDFFDVDMLLVKKDEPLVILKSSKN
ncbi:hypothetical protein [Sphingobacterium psychroaquaticum]|nr:hypothetical protein [Sphingobacterium psychroaquaticum]